MQGLQRGVCTAALWALCTGSVWAQPDPIDSFGFDAPPQLPSIIVAERVDKQIPVYSVSGLTFRLREIYAPGASFIRIHFSRFQLPDGIELEISNPDGSETWRYSTNHMDPITLDADLRDDGVDRFSAMSITGDTLHIRLLGDLNLLDPYDHQVQIDSWLEGLPLGQSKSIEPKARKNGLDEYSQIENACGDDERWGSICWANSNSWEYSQSAAVARLVTSKGVVCTAWRVGSDNHMFTAEHCIGRQSDLDGSEIWFNYESTSCGSSSTTTPVKVTGGTLLSRNSNLDYALFTVNNFSQIAQFPAFGLETETPPIGEPIFIPQHGLGMPRQISIESDMNASGECEVDATDVYGFFPDSDIGYYCDTATSSSGSPVVSNISGRVVALHHFGGCMNSGVKISEIWPDVESYFGGQVPSGNSGGSGGGSSGSGNNAPEAQFSVECDDLLCNFDGNDSVDPDGEIVSFNWDLGNGDSQSGAAFAYEYSEADTYDVTLTVEDDEGETATATRSVTAEISNTEPRAKFSASCVSNSCEFDASGSYDEDGEIESRHWTLGDGSTAAGQVIEHVYEDAGSYNVQLTVTDDKGASDSSLKQVSVVLPNDAPTASFDYSCNDLSCSFDSSGSSDGDGEIVAWSWSFGDGGTADGAQSSHSYQQTGSFDVTLTVTDNRGDTDSSTRTVSPSAANAAPSAAFSFSCSELECSFDASSSTDPDGDITAWSWSFGDGGNGDGQVTGHAFSAEGAYTVTLTVSDDNGDTDQQTRSVEVSEIPAPPEPEPEPEPKPEPEPEPEPVSNENPHAKFSYDCNQLECTFDSSGSYDNDGTIKSYRWSMGDGASLNGRTVQHEFGATGIYQVTLTVVDDDGQSGMTSRSIEAEEDLPEITLSGRGRQNNNKIMATLRWSGAESQMVDLYRDGVFITSTRNDGKLIDTAVSGHSKSAAYRLCQADSEICSNTVVIDFKVASG